MKRKMHQPGTWKRRNQLNQWYCTRADAGSRQWHPTEVCDIRFSRQGNTYSVGASWRHKRNFSCQSGQPWCPGCNGQSHRTYYASLEVSDPFGLDRRTLLEQEFASFEEALAEMHRIIDTIEDVPEAANNIMESLL